MFGTLEFGIYPFAIIDKGEEIADYGSYWLEQCKDKAQWDELEKDRNVVRDCQNGS